MYEKRSLAIAVSVFILGVVFGIAVNCIDALVSCAVFAILSVISVLMFVYAHSKEGKKYKFMVAVAFAVATFSVGALRVYVCGFGLERTEGFDGKKDQIIAEILEINENSIDAKIYNSEYGVPKGEKIKLYLSETPEEIIVGDYLKCDITYKYKSSNYLLADGITLTGNGSCDFYSKGSGIFYNIRRMIYENSNLLFGDFKYASEISRGVTIGDRTGMDSYVFSIYRVAGMSHVLAISGLHISIIAMSFYSFVMMIFGNRRFACICSAMLALIYSALVGFTPGAVRAAFMLAVVMILRSFMLLADGFTSIFSILGILIIINPYSVCSPGLQLSFLCSLGIMLVEPFIDNITLRFTMRKRKDKLWKVILKRSVSIIFIPVLISFVASVFSFPVVYANFDTISYISPLVNLLFVPLFTIAVEIAFVAYLISPLSIKIATIVAYPAGFLFDIVSKFAEGIFNADVGLISLHSSAAVIPMLLSLCMIVILLFVERKRFVAFFIAAALFCVSLAVSAVVDKVIYSDTVVAEYGNDDNEYQYIYLDTPEENTYIYISGYSSFTDVIYENGKTSLENYVLLNYNEFSLKNIEYMCGNLKVSKIYLPNAKNNKELQYVSEIKEFAKDKKCDIIFFENFSYENSDLSVGFIKDGENINSLKPAILSINDVDIRILSDNFDRAVKCDVAILSNYCFSDKNIISANNIFAQKEYINEFETDEDFSAFYQRIRIEYDLKESDYIIYEP